MLNNARVCTDMGKNAQAKLLWADAPFILSLGRGRSFAAAATDLGVDRTTVARRLERLEAQLGTMLFERVSGQLEFTQEGRRVMSFVERAEQELSQLPSDQDSKRHVFGKVRISVSEHVLAGFADQLSQFIVEHPEVFLELTTSDRLVDLYKYEADIILRIGKAQPDKLHSVDLGAVNFGLYQRASLLEPVETLLALPGQTELPKKMRPKNDQARIVAAIEGVLPTRDMILAGAGAGVLPTFIGHGDTRLQLRSHDASVGPYRLSMSCLPEQRNFARIRLVMTHLTTSITKALKELNKQ